MTGIEIRTDLEIETQIVARNALDALTKRTAPTRTATAGVTRIETTTANARETGIATIDCTSATPTAIGVEMIAARVPRPAATEKRTLTTTQAISVGTGARWLRTIGMLSLEPVIVTVCCNRLLLVAKGRACLCLGYTRVPRKNLTGATKRDGLCRPGTVLLCHGGLLRQRAAWRTTFRVGIDPGGRPAAMMPRGVQRVTSGVVMLHASTTRVRTTTLTTPTVDITNAVAAGGARVEAGATKMSPAADGHHPVKTAVASAPRIEGPTKPAKAGAGLQTRLRHPVTADEVTETLVVPRKSETAGGTAIVKQGFGAAAIVTMLRRRGVVTREAIATEATAIIGATSIEMDTTAIASVDATVEAFLGV